MKYGILLCSLLSLSLGWSAHAFDIQNKELESVREQLTMTVQEIQTVLQALCQALTASHQDASDTICRELSLLCTCTQTITTQIPHMDTHELMHLIDINEDLIDQLHNNIISENYTDFCNLDTAAVFTPVENKSELITAEQLQERLDNLAAKVHVVSELINHITTQITGTLKPVSFVQRIANNSGYILGGSLCIGLAYLLRHQDPSVMFKAVVSRLPIYSLIALYILRQKKDGDTKRFTDSTFGKDSVISKSILTVKQWVGSPREKKPALHIIARDDMTAAEQIAWAEANNCEIMKTDYKKRAIPYLSTFFDMDDSLFKWSFSWIFAQQLRSDVLALSNLMGENVESTVKKILGAK